MNNKADKNHSILHIFISSIYAHFIFICLVIFCFLFMSCGRASAAGLIQSDRDYIHSVFGDAWNETQWASVENIMDFCPYFIIFEGQYKTLYLAQYGSNELYDYWLSNNNFEGVGITETQLIPWVTSSSTGSVCSFPERFGRLMPYSLGDLSYSSNRYNYNYYYFSTFEYLGVCAGSQVYIDSRDYYASQWNCFWYQESMNAGNIGGFNLATIRDTIDLSKTKTNYNACVIHGEYSNTWTFEQNVFPVSFVEDSRLKFSTFSLPSGGYYLQTDIRQFGFDNIDGSSASQQILLDNNSIDLTFVCDEEVFEFTLDSSNSVISSDYIFSTEFSSLFNFDDFDSIYIDKAEFTQVIRYRVSEQRPDEYVNYKIDCEYYLKQPVPPVEIEDIEYDEYTDTVKVTQGEITERNEVINHDNGVYSLEYPGENELVVPEGFTVKIITVSADSSLADMINSLDAWEMLVNPIGTLYDLGEAAVLNVVGIDSTDEFNEFMDEDIKSNAYSLYYDIVCYYWTPAPSTGEVDSFYYYFTASGKIRTTNHILADIWVESNQTAYNTSAIYDYLYTRLNDFEYQSLSSFASMIDLDVGRNNWLATLDLDLLDGVSDIVDAVNAIEFDFIPFDDSDILSALSGISSQLSSFLGLDNNEDDTVAEAIAYYQTHNSSGLPTQDVYLDNKMSLWMSGKVHAWLQGSSATDSRQGLLIDSFDFMTQFFDSLQSHGLIGGVRNYVRSFTSVTSSGSAETVYKTIWTGSFNPNLKDGE